MSTEPIAEIWLKGDPKSRGIQHGKQLAEQIHQLYNKFMEVMRSEAPGQPDEKELLNHALNNLPYTREYAPDLISEMEGIAEGAKIDFEKVFFLNSFDEMSSYNPDSVPAKGCTSFAATGAATVNKVTYCGQGWDMDEWYIPYIMHIKGENDEPEVMAITHPGIISGAGMNSTGLALMWNSLKPSDTRFGVIAPVLIRKALQQRSLSELIGAIINARRANGMNFMLAAPFGIADLELTVEKFVLKYSSTILSHANHYEMELLLPYEELVWAVPDSLIRSGRMRQLLEENFGQIDAEVCKNILRDHANYPGSICRHHIPGRNNTWQTQAALIFIPSEGTLLASNGRPCESPFFIYKLESTAD